MAVPNYGVNHIPDAPLFSADNVVVQYDGEVVLHDVSFELVAGKQVAVVGPNGAGKSTLLKLMSGELAPSRGVVHLYGSKPSAHLCVGYVPQRKEIDWSFPVTVYDFVMMGRIGRIGLFRWAGQQDHAVVVESLERVNGGHLAQKQIGELSGGQQQRIFIARALAQEAELFLLDEPLAGLDIPSQDQFYGLLAQVAAAGITAIVATHDLTMAAQRFDQVILLNKTVLAIGAPEEVLTPQNLAEAYGGLPMKATSEHPTLALS